MREGNRTTSSTPIPGTRVWDDHQEDRTAQHSTAQQSTAKHITGECLPVRAHIAASCTVFLKYSLDSLMNQCCAYMVLWPLPLFISLCLSAYVLRFFACQCVLTAVV